MLFPLVTFGCWAVVALVNFWIWSKGKGRESLFMLVGSAAMAAIGGLGIGGIALGFSAWLQLAGFVLFTLGFVMSVRPQIEGQLAAIKAKAETMRASA